MIRTIQSKTGSDMPAIYCGTEWRILGRTINYGPPKCKVIPYSSVNPVFDLSTLPEYNRYQKNVPILDQNGNGCATDDTEILTNKGWVLWPEYNWSDPIGTMNPNTGLMEFQHPTAKHIYEYDGPMYYSTNRCLDFGLTPNHRLFVRKWDERKRTLSNKYTFVTVENSGWYYGLPHSTIGYVGIELERISIGKFKNIKGDDFIKLLAMILADGYAANDNTHVSFCAFKESKYKLAKKLAYDLGLHELPSRQGVWYWNDPELALWLKDKCYTSNHLGANTKKIPDIMREVSERQIKLFFEYFGDKSFQPNGTLRFHTISNGIADGLQELLMRVGKRSSFSVRPPRESMIHGRVVKGRFDDITLCEREVDRLCIDRKKHLETDRYKGLVYCATVPNGLLITRRNKSILISGNSCCGHAHTTIVLKARDLQGLALELLSADSLYAQINGGQDNGSNPSDAIAALQQNGICLLSEVPDKFIRWEQISEQAKKNALRFRIPDGVAVYKCANFQEAVSADYLGFSVTFTINCGNNFNNLSRDGVVGFTPGEANHSVAGGEAFKRLSDGTPAYHWRNSWNDKWGINGCAWCTAEHMDQQNYGEIYALRWTLSDPESPDDQLPF